ncbi:hypothetical protein SO802_031924 [Lithocarpus litseifolius]|uniref:RNase H type-1 domain-containing protein n=1 Tax=Lithocarpus litseifolius TaxID=425828 RepID=A0AAW2BNM9_9ROSI
MDFGLGGLSKALQLPTRGKRSSDSTREEELCNHSDFRESTRGKVGDGDVVGPSLSVAVESHPSLFSALNRSGFGAVIQNKKGEVMAAMATKGPEVSCIEETEFLTCRKAIEFAVDVGFSELVIEGDNFCVIKVVLALQDDYSLLGNVIGDIHHLVRNLQWVRIECTR